MNNFEIVPLSSAFVENIKLTNEDLFGNPLISEIATGYGPCRLSLQPFIPNVDERLLLNYSPFFINNAFNQNGPIFIHKKNVAPYSKIYEFPSAIKADKVNFPLSLIGYNNNQKMIFTKLVGSLDVDQLINEIFDHYSEIEYLHARNAEACCFICKIIRR